MRTSDDAHALVAIRTALASPQLALGDLYDRCQIAADLQGDPFNLNILAILGIGGLTAFLLAFLSNGLASWVSVNTRRSGFVGLRALGATPYHVAGILLWEQGMVYQGAFALGLPFGALLPTRCATK